MFPSKYNSYILRTFPTKLPRPHLTPSSVCHLHQSRICIYIYMCITTEPVATCKRYLACNDHENQAHLFDTALQKSDALSKEPKARCAVSLCQQNTVLISKQNYHERFSRFCFLFFIAALACSCRIMAAGAFPSWVRVFDLKQKYFRGSSTSCKVVSTHATVHAVQRGNSAPTHLVGIRVSGSALLQQNTNALEDCGRIRGR